MTFKKDLKFGQQYEMLFCEIMGFTDYQISTGKFKEYDIINNNIKYEVKCDRLAAKTGNVAIEYECFNKPSGITTTQADYYVYFILNGQDYDLFVIPVNDIKEYIKNNSQKYKNVSGGDFSKSKMYLIKINEFTEYKI